MIGLSRVGTQELRGVPVQVLARVSMNAGTARTSAALPVVEAQGRAWAYWDHDETTITDPARESTIVFEASPDGVAWVFWGSARVWGSATCPRTTQHHLSVPTPPDGWQMRTVVQVAPGSQPVSVGCRMELREGPRDPFIPPPGNSVAYDNSATATATAGTVTTGSFTITGSDLGFMVGVGNNQSGVTISSTTCGGVSGTSAGARAINGNTSVHLWYGVAPATGSQTASATGSDTWANLSVHAVTLTGVDQASPVSGYNSANAASGGTSDDITTTVSTTPDAGDMVLCIARGGGGGFLNATGSMTRRTFAAPTGSGTSPGTAGATVAFDGEFSSAWVIAAVQFNEAAAGGGAARGIPFGGAGTAFAGGRALTGLLRGPMAKAA